MTDITGRPMVPHHDDGSGSVQLAAELRRLRRLVAGARFDDLHDAVEQVRALAERLEAEGTMIDPADYETWGVPEHYTSNPAIGIRNPVSPPLVPVAHEDGTVTADVTLGIEYQGPPQCVHGGIVALLFDEMLGLANAAGHAVGMTVDLRVTYVSPTPLDTPLRFSAKQVRTDGRKIWAEASLHAGDRLCATCEGMFVTPKFMRPGAESRPVEG